MRRLVVLASPCQGAFYKIPSEMAGFLLCALRLRVSIRFALDPPFSAGGVI